MHKRHEVQGAYLLEYCPDQGLSQLGDDILIGKCHLQVHLGETGLSVTACVLNNKETLSALKICRGRNVTVPSQYYRN